MLQITIDSKIRLHNPPSVLLTKLKQNLSFPNPAYMDAISFGRTTYGLKKKIRLYEDVNGVFCIPRGSWDVLSDALNSLSIRINVTNRTVSFEKKSFSKEPKLRDYQEPWVADMLSSNQGIGVGPPGMGKTICSLSVYATLGQPCLWLTHTQRLAHQAAESASKFLGIESGIIGGGKEDIKHFTVGMIPTLAKKSEKELEKYSKLFGTVIADECFVAGTMIGSTPIEKIKVGDVVDSYDKVTQSFVKRRVVTLYKNVPKSLVSLHIGTNVTVTCTPNHKLKTIGGDTKAEDITTADSILTYGRGIVPNYWETVSGTQSHAPTPDGTFGGVCPDGYVYNFEVEGTHTYTANSLVVSNCHHIPAASSFKVLTAFAAKNIYGVTATPYREDKLERLIFGAVGPQLAYIDKETLRDMGKLMTPTIIRKHTDFYFPYNPTSKKHNYIKLVDAIANDYKRNQQIITDVIIESTSDEKNICIILVGRIPHGEILHEMLLPIIPESGLVHSKLKKKEVKEVLDNFGEGKLRVLIATYKMLAEGFDYQPTNRLFLTAPFKGRSLIEQACGRIERTYPGKKDAIVFDYVDVRVGVLTRQAETRLDVYEMSNNPIRTIK